MDELETPGKALGDVGGKVQFRFALHGSEYGAEFFEEFGCARPSDLVKSVTDLARVLGEALARQAVGQEIEECVELV